MRVKIVGQMIDTIKNKCKSEERKKCESDRRENKNENTNTLIRIINTVFCPRQNLH